MAKKYETVKDVLAQVDKWDKEIEELDKRNSPTYTNDLSVLEDKIDHIMRTFIKKLHPGTRVL